MFANSSKPVVVLVFLLLASLSSAQLVESDFNDLIPGDLSGQAGGNGWGVGTSFTPSGANLINVVSGDLTAPAFTNYAITQGGTGQHLLGVDGPVNYSRDLATPTGNSDDIWFSFIAQLGDLDGNGDSSGRTGINIDATASNGGRFLMRGISGGNMEIFREGGGSVDYPLDLNPFLVVGRLQLNAAGNDTLSWWYNPDVTTLDTTFPDDSFTGGDWDAGDGISTLGMQLYGGDEGRLDAFRFSNGVDAYMDVTGVSLPPSTTVFEWNLDADGNTSVGANWDAGTVPTAGSIVRFGNIITEDRTVNVDAPLSVIGLEFTTANGQYLIDGPSSLTLTGGSTVNVSAGSHTINAEIAGSNGLVKVGGGTLFLSGSNTYTGVTDVQSGTVRVTNSDAINDTVNVGSTFVFQGVLDENGDPTGAGFSGTFSPDITGSGQVAISDTLGSEVVAFDTAKSWDGVLNINGGQLEISDAGALGTGGATTASRTNVNSSGNNDGQLQLSNNITVSDELLRLRGREDKNPKSHVRNNSGNNTWASAVELTSATGAVSTIESASGNLNITGTIVEGDLANGNFETAALTLRLAGAGDGSINAISDVDGLLALQPNINLEKTGAGTWTIATASTDSTLYHQGTTAVKEGTLVVSASGNDGELRSSTIEVSSGATFDASGFGLYNLQVGQTLSGGGTVVGNLGTFNDNDISPGDNGVGTLNVNGNLTYSAFATASPLGINVQLGNTTTVGGGVNDLIDVSGSVTLAGNDQGAVNITPVGGSLATGTYSIIRGTSVSGSAATRLSPQIVGADGTVLTTRQTVSISNTGTTVDVNVSGSAANLVWQGSVDGNWDVNATANWDNGGGNDVYVDLDQVTFNDTAATTNVNVAQTTYPGQVTMSQSGTYTFTGANSIRSLGPIQMNSGTTVLANASNAGISANVASGATLQAGGSAGNLSTSFSGNVVAESGSTLRIGDDGFSGAPPVSTSEDFESLATGIVFQNNTVEPTSPLTGWQLIDARSSTSTQTGNDDVVMELNDTATSGISLAQTVANTDFPNGGSAHNGSMAISPLDTSRSIDTITAVMGQDDPSGGFADASLVFGFVDQDNYFYAQITQGEGIAIRHVVADVRSTLVDSGAGIGNFANNTPWDVTVVHNSAAGTATLTVTDGSNTQSVTVADAALTQDGLAGIGSHNDAWFLDSISVTTEDPSAAVFTVDGNLELEAGSVLEMDVASTANLDRLVVNGNLDANGVFELNATTSFMGAEGQVFDLIDFNSASGAFSSFDLPTLDAGLLWDTDSLLIDGTLSITAPMTTCDFSGDGACDLTDIDLLVAAIAAGTNDPTFDLTGDGFVDTADRDQWLADAGAMNLASGNSYLLGDANLDGSVDVSDFNIWNNNKFTAVAAWSSGDFNSDGSIDVSDFNIWNTNKFNSADGSLVVPEPSAYAMLVLGLLIAVFDRRRR